MTMGSVTGFVMIYNPGGVAKCHTLTQETAFGTQASYSRQMASWALAATDSLSFHMVMIKTENF